MTIVGKGENMENNNNNQQVYFNPPQAQSQPQSAPAQYVPQYKPYVKKEYSPLEKKDNRFVFLFLFCAVIFSDFALFKGFHSGFTIAYALLFGVSTAYLWDKNSRVNIFSVFCGLVSLAGSVTLSLFDNAFVNTIMLILMVQRHVKTLITRYYGQDYTILGSMGQELPGRTVGLIGGGRIGRAVARHLSGFGCRILMSDHHPSPELEEIVEYCDQEKIIEESDIISLHVPYTDKNAHMINAESISRMKDGVIIINTARGGLIDTGALIDAIESGKVGGAGLDLVEGDRTVYYRDFKDEVISFRDKAVLDSFPNVIMLPHMAFYTDQVVDDMIRYTLEDCVKFCEGEELPFRLV